MVLDEAGGRLYSASVDCSIKVGVGRVFILPAIVNKCAYGILEGGI